MEAEHRERHGLVWPVMLIGTGVVLLLSNTGRLPWGVWQTLLSLWPVLLIAAGLDLLFGRRSTWGALLAALLALAVLVGALYVGLTQTKAETVYRTQSISQPLGGATSAEVTIGFGAGTLNLDALTEASGNLIEGKLELGPQEQISYQFHQAGQRGDLRAEKPQCVDQLVHQPGERVAGRQDVGSGAEPRHPDPAAHRFGGGPQRARPGAAQHPAAQHPRRRRADRADGAATWIVSDGDRRRRRPDHRAGAARCGGTHPGGRRARRGCRQRHVPEIGRHLHLARLCHSRESRRRADQQRRRATDDPASVCPNSRPNSRPA